MTEKRTTIGSKNVQYGPFVSVYLYIIERRFSKTFLKSARVGLELILSLGVLCLSLTHFHSKPLSVQICVHMDFSLQPRYSHGIFSNTEICGEMISLRYLYLIVTADSKTLLRLQHLYGPAITVHS